jgi:hypothetical protein
MIAKIRLYEQRKKGKLYVWVIYKKECLGGPFSSVNEALQSKSEWMLYPYDLKSNGGYR